jgi:diguanylate cyclase
MDVFDWATGFLVGIPATMGLAAVALIGYLFGRSTSNIPQASLNAVGPRELHRAARIARQLEDTIEELRQQLAEHRTYVDRFKEKVAEAAMHEHRSALELLSTESEHIIMPTLRLASRLSHAYDELRQQSQVLSNFTEGRTDPVTGLGNTPALEEQLELALGDRVRGGAAASVALVSVDPPVDSVPGTDAHREFVKRIAGEIERCVRGHDYVARLGGVEFAILMPKTTLAGARVFGTRLRKQLLKNRGILAGCGIAEAMPADTSQSWLSRADSALYSARAAGGSSQFLHTGESLHMDNVPIESPQPTPEVDTELAEV